MHFNYHNSGTLAVKDQVTANHIKKTYLQVIQINIIHNVSSPVMQINEDKTHLYIRGVIVSTAAIKLPALMFQH
jgi:hypothetical protein